MKIGSITARAYRDFCQDLPYFGKGNLHEILTKNYEFGENQFIKSHASLRSVNENLSILTTFKREHEEDRRKTGWTV